MTHGSTTGSTLARRLIASVAALGLGLLGMGVTATSASAYTDASACLENNHTSDVQSLAGSGTSEDPYQIWSMYDLAQMSWCMADYNDESGGWQASGLGGLYFKQMQNIDLSGFDVSTSDNIAIAYWGDNQWQPIGWGDAAFRGDYDGGGFSVSHLEVANYTNDVGLFTGLLGATVHDLTINGFVESWDGYDANCNSVGGLAGYALGSTIENVTSNVDVMGCQNVGGLIGRTDDADGIDYTTIINSHATGTVEALEGYTAYHFGGLVGFATNTQIRNSSSSGNVSALWNGSSNDAAYEIGGLVGWSAGQGSVVASSASGNVTVQNGDAFYAGGLIGRAYDTVVSDSHATGSVLTSPSYWAQNVGGLIGYMYDSCSVNVNIVNSSASGDVFSNNTYSQRTGGLIGYLVDDCDSSKGGLVANVSASGDVHGASGVGGLIGELGFAGPVMNASASGNVDAGGWWYSATQAAAGGLIGLAAEGSHLSDVHASGDVTATGYDVGGLVGRAYNSTSISGASATGDVSGGFGYQDGDYYGWGLVGGLIGRTDSYVALNDVHAAGRVTSTYWGVGGLVGELGYSNVVTHSSATGNVSVNGQNDYISRVGGLVGYSHCQSTVAYTYATGNVRSTLSGSDMATETGGMVGEADDCNGGSYGSISFLQSYATGDVSSDGWNIGGFAGYVDTNFVAIDAYARGDVTSTLTDIDSHGDCANAGGFVGYIDGYDAQIANTYATGTVTAVDCYDSFANTNIWSDTAAAKSNFALKIDTADHYQDTDVAKDVSLSDLQDRSTFPGSWNFDSIWNSDSSLTSPVNDGLPVLRALTTIAPVTAPTAAPPACASAAIGGVKFAKKSAKLSKAAKAKLNTAAATIKASNCKVVTVTGAAPTRKLANARARAVIDHLTTRLYNLGYVVSFTSRSSVAKKAATAGLAVS